jgi:hypothetical protein
MAYVNLLDDAGAIRDTRIAYTDLDGYWEIKDLPGDEEYTWYTMYGPTTLDSDKVYVPGGTTVEIEEPDCFDPLALDVAVVEGNYDDFHLVLNEMGFANYELIDGLDQAEIKDFLSNAEKLAEYDIIFFNGGFIESEVIYNEENPLDADVALRLANLKAFVENGGTVYASDWAYDVVEIIWPEAADFVGDDLEPNAAQMGDYGSVTASVTDTSLSEFLGVDTLDILYDLPVWPPASETSGSVSVHLEGRVFYTDGQNSGVPLNSPLLFSFNAGQGKVVYSSFRVARNASAEMVDTLQYMMYSL